MKRSIVWILFLVVMLLVSLTAVAKENRDRDRDRDDCTCSLDMIAGAWGYTETGMQIISDPNKPPPTPLELLPYASVGSYTIDPQGNVSGQRTNAQSTAPHQTCIIGGIATVNPDCTGTLNVSFSNPPGITGCTGSATKLVVYVNNATEARMIIPFDPISNYPLPGLKASGVLTTDAKKLFPDSDNPGLHLGNCGH